MNQYVTGSIIKKLREQKSMTQQQLADKLSVSDKTISKWETGRGYPDITLLEQIAAVLDISLIELMSGENIINKNKCSNMAKIKIYVCPVCGNIICSVGESIVCCCGINIPALECEQPDAEHAIEIKRDEDEYYICLPNHEMTKKHNISFIMAVRDNGYEIIKLYSEGQAECRIKISRTCFIYFFCNHHGLFKVKL